VVQAAPDHNLAEMNDGSEIAASLGIGKQDLAGLRRQLDEGSPHLCGGWPVIATEGGAGKRPERAPEPVVYMRAAIQVHTSVRAAAETLRDP